MQKLLIFILISSIFLNVGCKKTGDNPEVNAFGFTTLQEAEKNLGKYAKAFYIVDGSIFTRFENYNTNNYSLGLIDAWFTGAMGAPRQDGGTFYLDNIEYYYDSNKKTYLARGFENANDSALMTDEVKKMYGKQLNAKLVRDGKEIFNTSYYVPVLLKAKVSNDILENTSFYHIDKNKGLNLKWNKDISNKNGVVIHIYWSGDKLDLPMNAQGTAGNAEFATKVDDTGELILPYSFFSRLPKNAIFSVNIIRGNIEVFNGSDNRQYKVYNQDEEKLSCVIE